MSLVKNSRLTNPMPRLAASKPKRGRGRERNASILHGLIDELRETLLRIEEGAISGVTIRDDLLAANALVNVLDLSLIHI